MPSISDREMLLNLGYEYLDPLGIYGQPTEHAKRVVTEWAEKVEALCPSNDFLEDEQRTAYRQMLAEATRRYLVAEANLAKLNEYWSEPTKPNSFYINGFRSRYDQLADLYDDEAAEYMRNILKEY